MPIYEYELITDDPKQAKRFELFQKMSDEPYTKHPETGEPIRRVICAPHVAGRYSSSPPTRCSRTRTSIGWVSRST